MSSPSPSDKAGWRGGKKQPWRGTPAGQKGWAKKKDREYEHAVRRHRLRKAASALVLVALVGALIYYLIPSWRRTPFLCVAVTDYAAPIPPNAWAAEDVGRFTDMDDEVLTHVPLRIGTPDRRWDTLRAELREAVPGGPDKDLIVVYLSMHGVVDGRNEPCLLPPGATPSMPGDWLRVADLLACFKERPGVKKLLILDANRIDMNWSLGLLANDFAATLKEAVEKNNDPELIVLNSAGPGQVGWAAAELGGSVFGHCVWRGLKGEADSNEDDAVSIRELDAYLKATVADWTTAHRDDVQTPMLLMPPGMDDHPVIYTMRPDVPQPESAVEDLRPEIADLWTSHEELARTGGPLRLSPLKWERFQQALLRLEQLAQAGPSYAQEFGKTKEEAAALAYELKSPPTDPAMTAHSLPLARRIDPWDLRETDQARRALEAWLEPPAAPATAAPPPASGDSPDDGAKDAAAGPAAGTAAKGDAEKPKDAASPQAMPAAPPSTGRPAYGRLAAEEAAWDWAVANLAEKDDLAKILAFAAETDPARESPLVETLFAWMLDTYLDPEVWTGEGTSGSVRTALRVRRLAEQAAAPRDERAQVWVRAAVDQADQRRRLAEDNLLVGGTAELDEAAALWQQAEGSVGAASTYADAIQSAAELAEALRTRDEAWAKAPYLVQWVASRLRVHHSPPDTLADPLSALIRDTRQLADRLREPATGDRIPPELGAAQAAVRSDLDGLLQEFNRAVELEPAAGDAAKLRRIATVLATPLVSGQTRTRLWDDYAKIARSIPSGFAVETAKDAPRRESQTAAAEPSTYLDFLQRCQWAEHPMLTILRLADQDKADAAAPQPRQSWTPTQLAAEGERIRHLLYDTSLDQPAADGLAPEARPPGDVYARAAAWLEAGPDAGDSATAARAGLARADRLVRVSAALLAARPWPDPQPDPTGRLRQFDLHCLMLWHADRAMDDFWGPTSTEPTPFFEIAAEDYLQSAARLCPTSRLVEGVRGRLARRVAAVADSPRPSVPPRPVDPNDESVAHGATIALGPDLPEGLAAFYLHETPESGRPLPILLGGDSVDRLPVDVSGNATESVRFGVLTREIRGATGVEAVAFYRGHVRECPCRFPPDEGWDIEYVPLRTFTPKITVTGAARDDHTVVFILDCSKSMLQQVGGTEGASSRIRVARDVLKDILSDLLRRDPSLRIGVMIYSRRAEWGRDAQGNIVAFQRTTTQVHPCADVEWLFRPGRLTQRDRQKVFEELDESQPGGSTPLYLSIVKAIREYRLDEKSRHVVVITDGMNDQLSTLPMPDRIDGIATRQDIAGIRAELQRAGNVRLDVIGFDLSHDTMSASDKSSYQAFRAFLGDRFYDAPNAAELKSAIFGALAPPKVTAWSLPEKQPAAEPVGLGATLLVEQRADRYEVRVEDPREPLQTDVALEGNEWLRMHVGDDGKRLIYEHMIPPGDPRGDPVLVAGPLGADRQGSLRIQAHRPRREDATLTSFDVSFWREDESQFTPRPSQVWMEVTPLRTGGEPDFVRVFYDRDFTADYPVPRLSVVAQNWPIDATAARIQVWLKYGETGDAPPSDDAIELALDELLPGNAEAAAVSLDGVTFEALIRPLEQPTDPCEVEIKEIHPPDGPLRYVKVDMTPTPEKVTRHFSPQMRTVRHTFTFRGVGPDQVEHYAVHLVPEKQLKDGAMSLPTPIVVDVPEPGQ